MDPHYQDRLDAGRHLATKLAAYARQPDAVVLALPRGGVPVAFEVAESLDLPLDIFLVRKLGVPGHEELAMGAIASGGARVLNVQVVQALHIPADEIEEVAQHEHRELLRREELYRGDRSPPDLQNKTVILIDDGLATGSTMRAAALAVRRRHPARIIIAVPVGAHEPCTELKQDADEVLCAAIPAHFQAVGQWYKDFTQTSDAEVRTLLERAWRKHPVP